MKAIVWTAYGPPDVLELREVETPVPGENDVLIRIHVGTVNKGDCELRAMKFSPWFAIPLRLFNGWRTPRRRVILGQEIAGEIVEVGSAVTRFEVGDRVFACTDMGFGGYAEYLCLPEDGTLAVLPANTSYAEAAPLATWASNALHFVRLAEVKAGESVLVNGAGGCMGPFGIQLAKLRGAEVTAVDSSEKFDMLRDIGADHVIDYRQQDFTRSGQRYDVIFDVVGGSPYGRSLACLKSGGRYVLANTTPPVMLRGVFSSRFSDKRVLFALASPKAEDLQYLAQLVEQGKLRTVIDRHYPLAETAAAHRYVETERKIGNVIIDVVPRP